METNKFYIQWTPIYDLSDPKMEKRLVYVLSALCIFLALGLVGTLVYFVPLATNQKNSSQPEPTAVAITLPTPTSSTPTPTPTAIATPTLAPIPTATPSPTVTLTLSEGSIFENDLVVFTATLNEDESNVPITLYTVPYQDSIFVATNVTDSQGQTTFTVNLSEYSTIVGLYDFYASVNLTSTTIVTSNSITGQIP